MRDDVSGVEAPVTIRTLRGYEQQPFFILVGERAPEADSDRACYDADAERLHNAFYRSLPSRTHDSLFRLMCLSYMKETMGCSINRDEKDSLLVAINMMDRNLAPIAKVAPDPEKGETHAEDG